MTQEKNAPEKGSCLKKTVLAGSITFLLLILFLFAGIRFWLTDDRLRSLVVEPLRETAGQEADIESLSLTFFRTFPQLGIRLQQLRIPDLQGEEMIRADEIVLSLDLRALFRNEISISRMEFLSPFIHYQLYPDSTSNFDFLIDAESEDESESRFDLSLPDITVRGGVFHLSDELSDRKIRMDGLNADIALFYGTEIESRMAIALESLSITSGGTEWVRNLSLSLNQNSVIDMNNRLFEIQKADLAIRGLTLDLSGSITEWEDGEPNLNLRFSSLSDNFGELLGLVPPEWQENVQDIQTRGALQLEGSITGRATASDHPDIHFLLGVSDGYLRYPDLPQGIEEISLHLSFTNDLVTLSHAEAITGSNQIRATGEIQTPLSQSSPFSLSLDAEMDLGTTALFYPVSDHGIEHLSGNLSLQTEARGDLHSPSEMILRGVANLTNASIKLEEISDPIEELYLLADASEERILIDSAGFRIGENTLSLSGQIQHPLDELRRRVDLSINGAASLSALNDFYSLEPWLDHLDGEAEMNLDIAGRTDDLSSLRLSGRLNLRNTSASGGSLPLPVSSLNGRMTIAPNEINLEELTLMYGTSDMTLDGTVRDYMLFLNTLQNNGDKALNNRNDLPAISVNFKSNHLNYDEMIDWGEEKSDEPYPVHLPQLTANAEISVRRMTLFGIEISEINGTGILNPEKLLLENASARLLDGKAAGSMTWNVPEPLATNVEFSGSLEGVTAQNFFRETGFLGSRSSLHRYLNGELNTRFFYQTELSPSLSIEISSTLASGSFGMSALRMMGHPIQTEIARFLRTSEIESVLLDQWEAEYSIDENLMTLTGMTITSANLGMQLEGSVHMITGELQYTATLFLPSRFKSGIASILSERAANALQLEDGRLALPIMIGGTIESPRVSPDTQLIEQIIRDRIETGAQDLLRRLIRQRQN